MAAQPKPGEMLVGAYLKLVEECEIVAYGQHSPIEGEQMEIDVIGIQPEGQGSVVTCEVATHLRGLGYGDAQKNRERVAAKFRNASAYVDRAFTADEAHRFQFWSPVVRGQSVTELQGVADAFEDRTGHDLELVINESYTERIEQLREIAASTYAQRNELAFRFLQILEHLP